MVRNRFAVAVVSFMAAIPALAARGDVRIIDSVTGYAVRGATLSKHEQVLQVDAEGYRSAALAMPDADTADRVDVILAPLVPPVETTFAAIDRARRSGATLIQGFVSDATTGLPIADARVLDTSTDAAGFFRTFLPAPAASSDGRFAVQKEGYVTHRRTHVEVWSGGDWTYQIRLDRSTGEIVVDEASSRRRPESEPEPPSNATVPQGDDTTAAFAPPITSLATGTPAIPAAIRVLTSSGSIDYLDLETYTKRVLCAEWIPSWATLNGGKGADSLKAGAVAVRTYGIGFVRFPDAGTYDICGTTSCQVYDPSKVSSYTNAATDATAGVVLLNGSSAITKRMSEYSAENNSLNVAGSCGDGYTGDCIYDPVCATTSRSGHGRGMCQWGSARWASGLYMSTLTPHPYGSMTWQQILNHYYPGFAITTGQPLTTGDSVKVINTSSTGLRVRACADGGIASGVNCTAVGTRSDGATGVLLSGPVRVSSDGNNYAWWKIQWSADGLVGWSADNYLERTTSVTQSCSYSLSPSTANGDGSGGTGSVQVSGSPAGCTGSWSASSQTGWLTLTGTSSGIGTGPWQVPYSYPVNPSTSTTRSGSIVFSGTFSGASTFTLTQSAAPAGGCSYSLSSTSLTLSGSAGSGSVQVSGSPAGCSGTWSAGSSQSWLTLTGSTSGSGPGPVSVPFSWTVNPSTTATRSASINFTGAFPSGGTLSVAQNPSSAGSAVNLAAFQPSGWSDKIVVSNVPGTTTNSTISPSDTVYVDWAAINAGTAAASDVFYIDLYLDGVYQAGWYVNPPLDPNYYVYVPDYVLGTLSPGTHTLEIDIDSTNAVAESNESDNRYTRTFSVGTTAAVRGDLNGDGRADVLWRIPSNGLNAAWLMSGPVKSVGANLESAGANWTTTALGDFNGDGMADIFWRSSSTGSNAMWLMNGLTKSVGAMLEGAGGEWNLAGIGDFNGDGKDDILWRTASGYNAIWLMDGTTKTAGAVIEFAPGVWNVAGVGDFDGDGKDDILWRDGGGNNALWLMNGFTKATGAMLELAGSNWIVAGLGDFNGDRKTDIFWRDPAAGMDAMWLMNGAIKSVGANVEGAPPNWRVASVGDYNGDGAADLLWRDDATGANAMWLMNGTTKSVGAMCETAGPEWKVIP